MMKKKNSELRNRVGHLSGMDPETAAYGISAAASGIATNGFAQTCKVKTAAETTFGIESRVDEIQVRAIDNKIEAAPVVSDAGIEYLIDQAFRRRVRARTDRVAVSVDDGVVKLWGSVPNWEEGHEVERAVSLLPGVFAVENNLKIEP